MRLVRVSLEAKPGTIINLHLLGDLHIGASDFDEPAFKTRVDLIRRDPNSYWIGLGDWGEMITEKDTKRHRVSDIPVRLRLTNDIKQGTIEWIDELIEPIADKCLGLGEGNHEEEIDSRHGGVKTIVQVACDLGIEDRFMGYEAFLGIDFKHGKKKLTQTCYFHHGKAAGGEAAFLASAEKDRGDYLADMYLYGHNHKAIIKTYESLSLVKNEIVPQYRTVANGGSWKKGTTYHPPVQKSRKSEVGGELWEERKGLRNRRELVGGGVIRLDLDYDNKIVHHSSIQGAITARTLGLKV